MNPPRPTLDTPLCEACGHPLAPGSRPVVVGACQFPFHLHDDCLRAMAPVTETIEAMCAWSDEQPEGLLWLGSWEPETVPTEEREGEQ